MADLLGPDAFEITAFEGRVLIQTAGFTVTLDAEAAARLSDQLSVACGSAKLQRQNMDGDDRRIDWV